MATEPNLVLLSIYSTKDKANPRLVTSPLLVEFYHRKRLKPGWNDAVDKTSTSQ